MKCIINSHYRSIPIKSSDLLITCDVYIMNYFMMEGDLKDFRKYPVCQPELVHGKSVINISNIIM